MKYEKLWIFLILYSVVISTLLIFALSNYITSKGCAYETKSDCRNSINGYVRTYDWMKNWAKSCESYDKIFTINQELEPRCINVSGVLP